MQTFGKRILILSSVVAILGVATAGIGVYYINLVNPIAPNQNIATIASNGPDPTHPKAGDFFPFGCGSPAIVKDLSCDKLPQGYVILPRLVNSPQPSMRTGMTDSAWQLLQKTFGNGVCDPNETWLTSPVDCAPFGNQVNDPYTGRPGAPASVCQLLPAEINESKGQTG